MKALVKSFWSDESGQAQVEYGLVIALVAVAAIGTLVVFRNQVVALFTRMGAQLDAAQ